MRFFDDLALGRKLVIIITGISGTALLVACLLIISYDIHRFRANQIEQLGLLSDVLGQKTAPLPWRSTTGKPHPRFLPPLASPPRSWASAST